MAEDATGKGQIGIVGQIIIAIAVALTAGGTAPWWLDFFRNRPNPAALSGNVGGAGIRPFTPVEYTGKGISYDPDNQKYAVYVFYRHDRQSDAEHVFGALRAAGYKADASETSLNEVVAPDKSPGSTLVKATSAARPARDDISRITKIAIPVRADRVSIFPDDAPLSRGNIQVDLF